MLVSIGAALVALVTACGSSAPAHPSSSAPASAGPHPVTTEEAERLAVSRFLNYQGTGVQFRTTMSSSQGPLSVAGYVDYRRRVGLAQVSGAGSAFVLEWNASTLLGWPHAATALPPTTLPTTAPSKRALAPSANDVDALLTVLLALGQDRPDNAQLIQQGGARWLRQASIGGRRVDVIAGPTTATGATGSTAPSATASTVTYWIDARGRMLRLDATLGGSSPTEITLDAAAFRTVPVSPALGA